MATGAGRRNRVRSSQQGHQAGAAKIEEFVGWCEEVGVEVVTLWLLSTDNLTRPPEELASLLTIITDTVNELAATRRWHVHPVGAPTCCQMRPLGR